MSNMNSRRALAVSPLTDWLDNVGAPLTSPKYTLEECRLESGFGTGMPPRGRILLLR